MFRAGKQHAYTVHFPSLLRRCCLRPCDRSPRDKSEEFAPSHPASQGCRSKPRTAKNTTKGEMHFNTSALRSPMGSWLCENATRRERGRRNVRANHRWWPKFASESDFDTPKKNHSRCFSTFWVSTQPRSDSVIRRCRLQCLLFPKADTAGRFMSTRPKIPHRPYQEIQLVDLIGAQRPALHQRVCDSPDVCFGPSGPRCSTRRHPCASSGLASSAVTV
jgi:hypothetical protein